MGRKLNEVLASLPKERQARIDALAQAKMRDMLVHASTLADIRKATGRTQAEVAEALGVNQNAISQLEQRSDMYLSTFRRLLNGMGMRLEFAVVTPDGQRVALSGFQPRGDEGDASAAQRRPARPSGNAKAAAPARKHAPAAAREDPSATKKPAEKTKRAAQPAKAARA